MYFLQELASQSVLRYCAGWKHLCLVVITNQHGLKIVKLIKSNNLTFGTYLIGLEGIKAALGERMDIELSTKKQLIGLCQKEESFAPIVSYNHVLKESEKYKDSVLDKLEDFSQQNSNLSWDRLIKTLKLTYPKNRKQVYNYFLGLFGKPESLVQTLKNLLV